MTHPLARRRHLAALAATALLLAGSACSSDGEPGAGDTTTTSADPATEVTPATDLRLDGVGPARLGQRPDEAVAALREVLGEPTDEQPWVQPSCELAGPEGDGARSVAWDGLTVTFRGAAEADARLAGWTYTGGPAGSAAELRLASGVGVGDPGSALADTYGTAATFVPFEVFDAHWEVVVGSTLLWAVVEGDAPDAPIGRLDLNPGICE